MLPLEFPRVQSLGHSYLTFLWTLSLSSNSYLILYVDDIILFKPIDESDMNATGTCKRFYNGFFITVSISTIPKLRVCLPPAPEINQYQALLWMVICTSVKHLEVTISHNLTWSHHISNMCRTTKRQLGRVHRQLHLHLAIFETRSTAPPFSLGLSIAAWSPSFKDKQAVENVQKFGWSCKNTKTTTPSVHHSTWNFYPQDVTFRTQTLLQNSEQSVMHPCQYFHPSPWPHPVIRHLDFITQNHFMPFVSTIAHKSSFFEAPP